MTEAEWLNGLDLKRMLCFFSNAYLRKELGERKFILFATACCRRVWSLIPDERSRKGIESAELYADGKMSLDDAIRWSQESRDPIRHTNNQLHLAQEREDGSIIGTKSESVAELAMALHAAVAANDASACSNPDGAFDAAVSTMWLVCCHERPDVPNPAMKQVRLLSPQPQPDESWHPIMERERMAHCNILRDLMGNPFRKVTWRDDWSTTAARRIAEEMYDKNKFDRLPEIADLLEMAQCTENEVLTHCRSTPPHYRGCWVVDLLTGRTG